MPSSSSSSSSSFGISDNATEQSNSFTEGELESGSFVAEIDLPKSVIGLPKADWLADWLKQEKLLYINGEFRMAAGGNSLDSENPANRTRLTVLPQATEKDIEDAVEGAQCALNKTPFQPAGRVAALRAIAHLLEQHRAELATIEACDNGKLYKEAFCDDLHEAMAIFHFWADYFDRSDGSLPFFNKMSTGFLNLPSVYAINPGWNFSLVEVAAKMAPLLGIGAAVIIQPSQYACLALLKMVELIHQQHILPAGFLSLLTGNAETTSLLAAHKKVAGLKTDNSVYQKAGDTNLLLAVINRFWHPDCQEKPVQIIFADTPDLEDRIASVFPGMLSHKGEKAVVPTKLLVEKNVYEQVLHQLISLSGEVICGNPLDPASGQGAQCFSGHYERIIKYIRLGINEGAELLAGGGPDRSGSNRTGYFIRPTVFGQIDSCSRLATEQILGPVICVTPFSGTDEALEMVSAGTAIPHIGIWSGNLKPVEQVSQYIKSANIAGDIFINAGTGFSLRQLGQHYRNKWQVYRS